MIAITITITAKGSGPSLAIEMGRQGRYLQTARERMAYTALASLLHPIIRKVVSDFHDWTPKRRVPK